MKYTFTKRRYLDGFVLLLLGLLGLLVLGWYIKPLPKIVRVPSKPKITTIPYNQFLYISNANTNASIKSFNISTQATDTLYSTASAQYLSHASLFYNHDLYVHGKTNFAFNITSGIFLPPLGDNISPDGRNSVTTENPTSYGGSLVFSLVTAADKKILSTKNGYGQLDNILGWSSDSSNFYYTITYDITTATPKADTDHWMQMINGKLQPQSRVRSYTLYSTASAQMVYQINTNNKKIVNISNKNGWGIIHRTFYNTLLNRFFLEKDNGLYTGAPSEEKLTLVPLDAKIATSSVSLIFDTLNNGHRFLHSDGKGLALVNMDDQTDTAIYYASKSATLIPLALNGYNVVFSLQDDAHYTGEILDTQKHIRTEFINQQEELTATTSAQPLNFVSWIKSVIVTF